MPDNTLEELGSAATSLGTGVYNGVKDGVSTVARGTVDAGRQTLESVTDLSSPDTENPALFFAKGFGKGVMELGGSIVSGGINAIESVAQSVPDALGHLGKGAMALFTPDNRQETAPPLVAKNEPPAGKGEVALGNLPRPNFAVAPPAQPTEQVRS